MKLTRKKVAIFVDSRKESGGAYQEVLNFLRNIKKYNQDNIEFLIICTSRKLNLKLEDQNLELHYFSMNVLERWICYLRNFGPFVRRIKKYFFIKNKFENFLKRINVDLVFFAGPSQYSLYLEDTKFFITIPDVDHRENIEFPEIVDTAEFHRKDEIFQKALPKAIAVITNAQILKERISFFYGVLEKRIFIINFQPSSGVDNFKGINLAKQKKTRESLKLPKNYIFYPAVRHPHKNHRNLVDALKILRSKFKIDLQMVFCGGDTAYTGSLKEYINNQDLNDHILFLDFVENDILPYLYLDAFIMVMPSLIGPTNIPPWEAFKTGTPAIYSELEGIKDVLGDAVYYIDPLDPNSIAKGIKEIYENKELRNKLIISGKKRLNEIKARNEFKQFFEIIKRFRKIRSIWEFNN
mgnify:CR=1 FL=1